MESKVFNELYKKLNLKQKEAVDTIEGPVMVVAGPGTGKTQILGLRIANILRKTDASPDSILALTFTDSGVHSMRKRLVSIMGSQAYRVNIFTFHGFCNNLIKTHPEYFDRIISSRNISPLDQIKMMESVVDKAKLQILRPFGDRFYYVESIIRAISDLKREGVSPDDFAKLLDKEEALHKNAPDLYHTKGAHAGKMKGFYIDIFNDLKKNKELLLLYKNYEKALRKEQLYDYDDMIMEVVAGFRKNEDLLLKLQENYQYILVDEHQDTNNAQNSVLELLAGFYESPNLFIVGDEKQAIFRFQGASLNNFLYFKDLYKGAKIIQLEDNYRSTQTILDSAHSLITKGGGATPLRARLIARAKEISKNIALHSYSSEDSEIFGVIKSIQNKLGEGVKPGGIAVIYRDNKDAFPLGRALERTQIPFVIESDQNILEDEDIKKLVTLMEAVNDFGNEEKFLRCLHLDFVGIDEFFIYRIINYSRRSKKGVLEILSADAIPDEFSKKNISSLKNIYERISLWSKLSKNIGLLDFFETLVRDSGFLNYLLCGNDSVAKMEKLSVIFDNIKKIVGDHRDMKLGGFMEFLEAAKGRRLLKSAGGERSGMDAVHLMTAHRSKGLEFDHVYIIGLYDTHWGNRRTKNHFKLPLGASTEGGNDDERRLFYVALTRAKKDIFLSYSKKDKEGKLLLPSQFLEEMDAQFLDVKDEVSSPESAKEIMVKSFEPKVNRGVSSEDKNFLNEIFVSQGFSVTALNNYLDCPWSYFYRNLIRIPEAPDKFLMFGNAIHYTLKDFFDKLKDDEDIGAEKLLKIFEKYLKDEPLSDTDLKETLKRGKEALKGYYKQYIKEWSRDILNEFKVHIVLPDMPVTLTGKIDKIEILDGGNNVNVVDYKTGKIKSKNDIEGKTKNSDGNMKRQLAFYRLLLDNYDGAKYDVRTGEIDFIMPDTKGGYRKEKIDVTEEDVSELKELIKKVSNEILNLDFWDKRCADDKCKYCSLRNSIKGACKVG